jgi:flagellar basal-body rod protein FlgG
MIALGENLYATTPASGEGITGFAQEDGFGRIMQGSLETSNVEIVQEMVDMIAAQRAYEINARAIRAAEENLRVTVELLR